MPIPSVPHLRQDASGIPRARLASRAGVGRKLEWDVEKLTCTNIPEVNQWVKRDYRKSWEV